MRRRTRADPKAEVRIVAVLVDMVGKLVRRRTSFGDG